MGKKKFASGPVIPDLFCTFFKIGCFTFGGGYAMIAIIEDACVDKKKWITHDDMMNVTVVAESTPGSIGINCSTFVGYRQAGMAGAVSATIGMVLPSFLIILAISYFLDDLLTIPWVDRAFQGIRVAVGIIIADAGIKMLKKTEKTPFTIAMILVSFLAMALIDIFSLKISSIVLMLFAALAGIALFSAKTEEKEGDFDK